MKKINHLLATSAVALTLAVSLPAMAYTPPAPQQQGDITYITGGIGERETEALRSDRSKYALRIVNAGANGAFNGNTHITLLDNKGYELLDVDGGPLLYANLPAGNYTVIARSEKRTQIKSTTITSGKRVNVRFFW